MDQKENRIDVEREIQYMEKNRNSGKIVLYFQNGHLDSVMTEKYIKVVKKSNKEDINKIL